LSKERNHVEQDFEEINKLIDANEIDELEAALDQFMKQNEFPYELEESKVFAKRIIKRRRKEQYVMKKSLVTASIIGICLIGTTITYASGLFKKFTFLTEKGTAIVKTTENLTEEQAEQMVDRLINLPEDSGEQVETIEPVENRYTSIEEAEKDLDFPLILPSNIPEQFKEEKEVMVLINPIMEKTYVYVIFKADTEETNSILKIDIIKETVSEGTSISVRQTPGEIYTTKDHIEYEITREQETCLKATTYVGAYEYGIFTNGIEEAVFYDIIDSVDVSAYNM